MRLRTADGLAAAHEPVERRLELVGAGTRGCRTRRTCSSVITTNPLEARNGPVQATNDSGDTNPGMTAMAPKVPWLVSFG